MIDIGLNLTHDSFAGDRDALLESAVHAGVRHMIVTGSTLASSQAAIDLVREYPSLLRATAGVHPHHAGEFDERQMPALRNLLQQPDIVASGECGLDYFRNYSSHAHQERAFRLQLQLASEIGKPLFLHQRDAHDAFLGILRDYWPSIGRGVAHCFTGTRDEAKSYLDLGLHVGVTGWICDERRGTHLREVVRYVPRDRLLVETDAPYLLPRDLHPKPASRRNEPKYLPHIVATIARCRAESPEDVAAFTTANCTALFGWPTQ